MKITVHLSYYFDMFWFSNANYFYLKFGSYVVSSSPNKTKKKVLLKTRPVHFKMRKMISVFFLRLFAVSPSVFSCVWMFCPFCYCAWFKSPRRWASCLCQYEASLSCYGHGSAPSASSPVPHLTHTDSWPHQHLPTGCTKTWHLCEWQGLCVCFVKAGLLADPLKGF